MSITPPALVAAPPRPALPFGLFSVLAPREGSDDRWEGGGIEFETLGCPPAPGSGLIGPYDCEGETPGLPKQFDSNVHRADAAPFTIYQSEVCSPIGNDLRHSMDVARGRLDLFEERLVETKLWQRFVQELDLATPGTSFPTGADKAQMAEALATLLRTADDIYGTLGVVHMWRETALLMLAHRLLEVRQGRLYTLTGEQVVAGSGYQVAVAGGVVGQMFWTPQLVGYRSDVFTSTNRDGDLLDRGQNDLYAVAERSWVVAYDDTCFPDAPAYPLI